MKTKKQIPYVIEFQNGFKITFLNQSIEEVKKETSDFLKFAINGKSCLNVDYTVRNATKKEINIETKSSKDLEKKYRKILSLNKKINKGNIRCANAKNINQFMNAYNG